MDHREGRVSASAPSTDARSEDLKRWRYRRSNSAVDIRPARVGDAQAMARVHVGSWQETYRGLMSDEILDNPGFVNERERFWTTVLTDERFSRNRISVAERDGHVIGIAMAGPPEDTDASWDVQLYLIYVYSADHGSGAGPALLAAVLECEESASLWVADPNPRAQAFYRKHGFVVDGTSRVDDGVREIQMIRAGGDRISHTAELR